MHIHVPPPPPPPPLPKKRNAYACTTVLTGIATQSNKNRSLLHFYFAIHWILTIFLSRSCQVTFHDYFGPRPIERRRSCKDRQLCMGDWRISCLRLIVYKTKNLRPRHPNVNVIFRPFALPPLLTKLRCQNVVTT